MTTSLARPVARRTGHSGPSSAELEGVAYIPGEVAPAEERLLEARYFHALGLGARAGFRAGRRRLTLRAARAALRTAVCAHLQANPVPGGQDAAWRVLRAIRGSGGDFYGLRVRIVGRLGRETRGDLRRCKALIEVVEGGIRFSGAAFEHLVREARAAVEIGAHDSAPLRIPARKAPRMDGDTSAAAAVRVPVAARSRTEGTAS